MKIDDFQAKLKTKIIRDAAPLQTLPGAVP